MLTQRCLENLRTIVSIPGEDHHFTNLDHADLHAFYLEIAEIPVRLEIRSCRSQKAKYLIWHFGDLLPAVQANLVAFLSERWPRAAANAPSALDRLDQPPLAATRQKNDAIFPEPEKKDPIHLPGPMQTGKRQEDWFDTALSWMAIIANFFR